VPVLTEPSRTTARPTAATAARRSPRHLHFDPLLGETTSRARPKKARLVAVSITAHALIAAALVILPKPSLPLDEPWRPITFVLAAPPPVLDRPIPPPAVSRREPDPPRPKPVPETLPEPVPPPMPRPEPTRPPAPRVEPPPSPKPAPVVRTSVFGDASVEPRAPTSKPARAVTITPGFDADTSGARPAARGAPVLTHVGFDGDVPTAPDGGRVAPRGVVASAGLDATPVAPPAKHGPAQAVHAGGFDLAAAAPEPRRPTARSTAAVETAVEILTKPKPEYTEEARRLRIEGDVVLRVTFQASGTLVVHGVVEGLGHGLDDAAVAAAKKITFKPARRNGQPVDYTATLRVVFRLA